MSAASVSKLYKVERFLAATGLWVMGLIVFLDVVHRAATRTRTSAWPSVVGWSMFALMLFGALRMRGLPATLKTAALAVWGTASAYGLLALFVLAFPNGLVWSQTLGLVFMLWVGCLGASMATHERRHLALDLGSKLWPKQVLPYAQALGHFATALFCLLFSLLSVVSVRSHFTEWSETSGAGGIFVALAIPKFMAFAIIPVSFVVMAARFAIQGVHSARGEVFEEDTLQMLGLDKSDEPQGGPR